MTTEIILFSETLNNLIVLKQVLPTGNYQNSNKVELITEFGSDPTLLENVKELEKNLKLRFVSFDLICD